MFTITAPFKTLLGQEELRTRAHKLGQRHRTILFLIDGRRPLSEVLSLAHQAGSATSHFEDLLRIGLVELPPDPVPPSFEVPTLTDELSLTSVDMVVVEAVVEQTGETVAVHPELSEPSDRPDEALSWLAPEGPVGPAQTLIEALTASPLREGPAGLFERTARLVGPYTIEAEPEGPFERTMRQPEPLAASAPSIEASEIRSQTFEEGCSGQHVPVIAQFDEQYGAPSASPPCAPAPRAQPDAGPDIALPIPDDDEAKLLRQIRELLTDALRLDAPLFSARTFMRVRSAQSTGELIDLVWEIEDHLSHKRRSRRELQSLQRARELLGLGNTLVAGDDSRPDYPDE